MEGSWAMASRVCISLAYVSAVSGFGLVPAWSGRMPALAMRRRCVSQSAASNTKMEINKYSKKLTQNKSQGASQVIYDP
jgi:hypothetical protein